MNGGGFPVWIKAVAQVGFPIALALWLIMRADPAIQETRRVIQEHQTESHTQVQLLRNICRSVAKSEWSAETCDR